MDKSISILVIDVEEGLLFKAVEYLGCKSYFVHSVNEARQIVESNKSIDLILVNLFLSENQGINTISSLQEFSQHIPIIASSDSADDEVIRQVIRQGASGYVIYHELNSVHLQIAIQVAIERNRFRQKLRALSFTDELTDVYNRRGFLTLLEQQLSLSKRSLQGFYLFIIDLDYLKVINDTYGHLIGDQALIDVANCLTHSFRHHDIVGRIGGDEFGIIAINSTVDSLDHLKNNILRNIQLHNEKASIPYQLSVSIGAAYYNGRDEVTTDQLFRLADMDLYVSKRKTHVQG